MREVEPHVAGIAALHSPQTAIVDFVAVARGDGAPELEPAGGEIRTERPGRRRCADVGDAATVVVSPPADGRGDRVVVCAGLHADRLARVPASRRRRRGSSPSAASTGSCARSAPTSSAG